MLVSKKGFLLDCDVLVSTYFVHKVYVELTIIKLNDYVYM